MVSLSLSYFVSDLFLVLYSLSVTSPAVSFLESTTVKTRMMVEVPERRCKAYVDM